MDYRIFNARTDVNACDCAGGCTDTVKESALKADSGIETLPNLPVALSGLSLFVTDLKDASLHLPTSGGEGNDPGSPLGSGPGEMLLLNGRCPGITNPHPPKPPTSPPTPTP